MRNNKPSRNLSRKKISNRLTPKPKSRLPIRHKPPFPRYPLSEYQRNPSAVKKSNDALYRYAGTLYDEKEQLRMDTKELERGHLLMKEENAILRERVRKTGVMSAFQSFLAAFGSVLISIGAGVVYSYSGILGWVLIFGGIVLLIAAFIFYSQVAK